MRVFIRTDNENRVIDINSEIFVSDISDWVEIDSGNGDRFVHAQGNYFPQPLTYENGVYRYKYENGSVCERSNDEMAADLPEPDVPIITEEQRLTAVENAVEEIIDMLMEV